MNQTSEDKNSVSKKENCLQKVPKKVLVAFRESFSGPLPHPNILSKYEQIQKGTAHRIIKMAECQSTHRQSLEKKVIESNILNERIGMGVGLLINLSVIGGAIYLIRSDKQVTGLTSLIIALGIQVYNSYTQQKKERELQQKNDDSKK